MEVLLQDYTGAVRACYQTVRRLFSLFDYQTARGRATNQPDDDGCCCCSCLFFKPKTDLFKYYYYSLITLLRSLRLRPLLHQTPTTLFIFLPHGGKFFPQHCSISNLPPGCWKLRDLGSGGGNFILEEIFTSPGTNLTVYY